MSFGPGLGAHGTSHPIAFLLLVPPPSPTAPKAVRSTSLALRTIDGDRARLLTARRPASVPRQRREREQAQERPDAK